MTLKYVKGKIEAEAAAKRLRNKGHSVSIRKSVFYRKTKNIGPVYVVEFV